MKDKNYMYNLNKNTYKKIFKEYQKNQLVNTEIDKINFFTQQLDLIIKMYNRKLIDKKEYKERRKILENEYLF